LWSHKPNQVNLITRTSRKKMIWWKKKLKIPKEAKVLILK
jgi:hypothetical protein